VSKSISDEELTDLRTITYTEISGLTPMLTMTEIRGLIARIDTAEDDLAKQHAAYDSRKILQESAERKLHALNAEMDRYLNALRRIDGMRDDPKYGLTTRTFTAALAALFGIEE
jgi:hypothetical protein